MNDKSQNAMQLDNTVRPGIRLEYEYEYEYTEYKHLENDLLEQSVLVERRDSRTD